MTAREALNPRRPKPPRLARTLIRAFSVRAVRDSLLRDAEERFGEIARRDVRAARRWYWSQALRCLSPIHRGSARPLRSGTSSRSRPYFGDAVQESRYAVRQLTRRPWFSIVAILTLGLAIGATTSIFSVVNGVLLRPLPYPAPDRLVNVWQVNDDWFDSPNPGLRAWADAFPISFPVFRDWAELNPVFTHIGAFDDGTFVLSSDRPRHIRSTNTTSGVWAALGVPPVLGRTMTPSDDEIGAAPVAVLSHAFWEQEFGADPNVVGSTLRLDETAHTIVGIMDRGFYFPSTGRAVWTNFDDEAKQQNRGSQFLRAVARMRPGVTVARAQREMESVTQRIVERTGGEHQAGVRVVARIEEVVGDVRLALLVLVGSVGVVLVIACANITNMLLVRATNRRRELAIRSALGAWRSRLLRQLLGESVVLALAGGVVGAAVAVVTFEPLRAMLPPGLPRADEIVLDYRVFVFAAGLSLLTGIVVGMLPALRASRTDVSQALQDGGRGFTGGRARNFTHGALVSAEIALAFVLMTGAGLLVKSFMRLTSVERGFDAERVLMFNVDLPERAVERVAYIDRLLRRLEAVPDVQRVAAADNMPFGSGTSSGTTTIESSAGIDETNVQLSAVSPTYFRALGIPIVAGREFSETDGPGGATVAIVSRQMAEEYWPDEDPIGWRVKRGSPDSDAPWMTVIGVAGDVRHQSLHVDPSPKLYRPFAQRPRSDVDVIVKTFSDPTLVTAVVRDAVAEFDPTIPIPTVRALEERVTASVATPRFRTRLLSLLALLAAFLAVTGVYAVLAFAIAQRTPEIGIRMVLGARVTDVLRSVLARGATLAGIGLAVGLAVAVAAVRVLQSFLYDTSVYDPLMFGAAAVVLSVAALLAAFVPASRAARVDPVDALRQD